MINDLNINDSILRIKDTFLSKFSFPLCFILFLFLLIIFILYSEVKKRLRKDINFNKNILIEKINNNKNIKNNIKIRNIIPFGNYIIIPY